MHVAAMTSENVKQKGRVYNAWYVRCFDCFLGVCIAGGTGQRRELQGVGGHEGGAGTHTGQGERMGIETQCARAFVGS